MQDALLPEMQARCGNPECGKETPENRSRTGRARYCSSACATKAAQLRRAERHATAESKVCPKCGEDKTIDQYHRPGRAYCRDCDNAMKRERYRAKGGKEAVYAQNLLNNYGMTLAEYEVRVGQQDGRCAICGTRPDHRLHVDHDHRTGAVRDLLCRPCNYALGHAKDSLRIMRAMVAYLERHAEVNAGTAAEGTSA